MKARDGGEDRKSLENVEHRENRGRKGGARPPFIHGNGRNAFIFVPGESSANNRTPITLVHLGRRSTYFRQIGRNDVGFSIDRTRNTPRALDENLPRGFPVFPSSLRATFLLPSQKFPAGAIVRIVKVKYALHVELHGQP